jgi:hypothetical protein
VATGRELWWLFPFQIFATFSNEYNFAVIIVLVSICELYTCLMRKTRSLPFLMNKIVLITVNMVCSCYFFHLLSKSSAYSVVRLAVIIYEAA